MFYLTTAFALVAVVLFAAVLALRISLAASNRLMWRQLHSMRSELDKNSSTQLRTELDDLAAAVAKLSHSVKKQFGGVWAELELQRFDPEDELDLFELKGSMPAQASMPLTPVCSCGWCQVCKERATRASVNGADHG